MGLDIIMRPPDEDDPWWFKFSRVTSHVQSNSEKLARLNRAILAKQERHGKQADIAAERSEASLLNQLVNDGMLDMVTICVRYLEGRDVDPHNPDDWLWIQETIINNTSKADLEGYFTQLASEGEEQVPKSGKNGASGRHARTIEGKGHRVSEVEGVEPTLELVSDSSRTVGARPTRAVS